MLFTGSNKRGGESRPHSYTNIVTTTICKLPLIPLSLAPSPLVPPPTPPPPPQEDAIQWLQQERKRESYHNAGGYTTKSTIIIGTIYICMTTSSRVLFTDSKKRDIRIEATSPKSIDTLTLPLTLPLLPPLVAPPQVRCYQLAPTRGEEIIGYLARNSAGGCTTITITTI